MTRRLVILVALLAAIGPGVAAAADSADVRVTSVGGRLAIEVQNTGDSLINALSVIPGPGLSVASVASSSSGSCQLTGPTIACTGLALAPPLCACQPGQILTIFVMGAGDGAGSSVTQISGTPVPMTVTPKPQAPTSSAANVVAKATAKAPAKTKAKTVAVCKKGQHSTKSKPCRKK
jgi:hypothetical protein